MSTAVRPEVAGVARVAPRTQAELASVLLAGFDALDARLSASVGPLSADRRRARPADGGWSVDEVLEHMRLLNEAYLPPMREMVSHGASAAGGEETPWHPALLPGLLTRALESPRPMPAPGSVRPRLTAEPHATARALEAVAATHTAVRDLVGRAHRMHWRAMRMRSPFAWVVRPNFGDACLLVLRHGERHAAQIERLAAATRAG